jgi:hypothetical protein
MSEEERVQQWDKPPALDHEVPNTKQFLNSVTNNNVRSGMLLMLNLLVAVK